MPSFKIVQQLSYLNVSNANKITQDAKFANGCQQIIAIESHNIIDSNQLVSPFVVNLLDLPREIDFTGRFHTCRVILGSNSFQCCFVCCNNDFPSVLIHGISLWTHNPEVTEFRVGRPTILSVKICTLSANR